MLGSGGCVGVRGGGPTVGVAGGGGGGVTVSCWTAICWTAVVVWKLWLALLSAVTIVSLGLRLRVPGPDPKLSPPLRADWPELAPENPELCAASSALRPPPLPPLPWE